MKLFKPTTEALRTNGRKEENQKIHDEDWLKSIWNYAQIRYLI